MATITSKETNIFKRQDKLLNAEAQKANIRIIGAGSIGSNLCLLLAKMGFSNIAVYDFDIIEAHNQPNQLYGSMHVGEYKVEALQSIVEYLTDQKIAINNKKILSWKDFTPETGNIADDIVILALDSLPGRLAIVSSMLADNVFPKALIDLRMGGEGHNGFLLTKESTPGFITDYQMRLQAPAADLPCGQESILYTLWNCVSEGAYLTACIARNEPIHSHLYIREMKQKRYITNTEVKQ